MVAGESCCCELVVSDGVVLRKYKILYFPHFQYEESIKFSYFSRIQTKAIKQMVTGVVNGLCRMVLGCTTEILWGEGQGWLMGTAVKDV